MNESLSSWIEWNPIVVLTFIVLFLILTLGSGIRRHV